MSLDAGTKIATKAYVDNAAAWLMRKKSTAYVLNSRAFIPTNLNMMLKCTTAGTTGSGSLSYSGLSIGSTVTDGTVVWTVVERDTSGGGSGGGAVSSVNGYTGDVTLSYTDVNAAPLASPAFTGTPAAPTATSGTSTTQIATTAFVADAVSGKAPLASPAFTGTPTAPTAASGTSSTQIATTAFVADAVSGKAPLASPTFTGTPAAPTAASGTSSTQIATTAFVAGAISAKAPIASPTFTGTPKAPTAASGTSTTQIATTAFVASAVSEKITDPGNGTAGDVLKKTSDGVEWGSVSGGLGMPNYDAEISATWSTTAPTGYTATVDCYVAVQMAVYSSTDRRLVVIDGNTKAIICQTGGYGSHNFFPVKAGQRVAAINNSTQAEVTGDICYGIHVYPME